MSKEHLRSRLEAGIKEANEGRTKDLGDFTQYVEPAWKAELWDSLREAHYGFRDLLGLIEPHIRAAEQRGFQAGVNKTGDSVGKLREQLKTAREDARREAWEKAAEVADETAAYLHRNYESEQANGAYKVLEDLRRESP